MQSRLEITMSWMALLYDVLDGTSLNRFLGDFEMYFNNKYKGSDRQKGKHLGTFLTGSLKQAYNAIIGFRLRFSVIRPQLLTWYRNEKTSRHQKYETEFSDARIIEKESLRDNYALNTGRKF